MLVDVRAVECAIEDHAWGVPQLIAFTQYASAENVGNLAAAAPHLINIRDLKSGDTVLHCFARERNLAAIQKWLSKAVIVPIPNKDGLSALYLAIQMQEKLISKALWSCVTPSLSHVSSPLVTIELKSLAIKMPELVLPFMLDMESSIWKTLTTFRSPLHQHHHEEVCGMETLSTPGGLTAAMLMPDVPATWAKMLPDPQQGSPVLLAWKVLTIPHILSQHEDSPFHQIVANCDALVFQSKLIRLIVQYKWEMNVWPRMKLQIAGYAIALLLTTAATVTSSRATMIDKEEGTVTLTLLMVAMSLVEGFSVLNESYQLAKMGFWAYANLWNVIDLFASVMLLLCAQAHFTSADGGVRSFGAVGVALKWLGFVDFLRCFGNTGSLVRMVVVILSDIRPFLVILSLSLVSSASFLMVYEPHSTSFGFNTSENGVLWPLMTVFLAMMGSYDVEQYHGSSMIVLLLFLFMIMLVLLNVLIAISKLCLLQSALQLQLLLAIMF
eukprot:COSAG01_NODE_822_length_13306_cov_4.866132_3_plen_497_part_00